MSSTISTSALARFARNTLGLSGAHHLNIFPLGGRGSERAYYRVQPDGDASVILVHYNPKRTENIYFADVAAFLSEINVPVPRVIRHSTESCLILMEDLGDSDLWSLRAEPWEKRGLLYLETLRTVRRLHSCAPDAPATRGIRLMEPFGPDLYKWERDYFLEYFVKGLCRIDLPRTSKEEFDRELLALAGRMSGSPLRLVHRDLQSQNVMIRTGRPVLIDFQGMRLGSPFYDLGSLLYDPYVQFSDDERAELLAYAYDLEEGRPNWTVFQECFYEASAQRLMQALGAFGFLGLKKSLPAYLDHVPRGLDNLLDATGRVKTLSRLREVGEACRKAHQDRESH